MVRWFLARPAAATKDGVDPVRAELTSRRRPLQPSRRRTTTARERDRHGHFPRTYVAAATNWPAWRCSCDVSPALTIETSINDRPRRSATLIILQGNHSST